MKTIILFLNLLFWGGHIMVVSGAAIPRYYLEVIPNELRTTNSFGHVDYEKPANSRSIIPFPDPEPGVRSVRYQQIINADQFELMPTAGAWIHRLGLRSACGARGFAVSTNLEIRFSTTQRQADQLSSNFAENIGPDETKVYGPDVIGIPNGRLCSSGVVSDTPLLILSDAFFYNPKKGNLLVDMRVSGIELSELGTPFLEAQDTLGDGISRAYAISPTTNPTNEVAQVVETVGLFMVVEFATGAIDTYLEADGLKLFWRNYPKTLQLQTSDTLVEPRWGNYTGEILDDSFTKGISIPLGELRGTRYFRLIPGDGTGQP